ncbi:MAG: hypothetical protein ACR2QF_00880 [Geminicoccaceae bacterium]
MNLVDALKHGHRIRHCNWPPYHYAQLNLGPDGKPELWRFAPHADAMRVELSAHDLRTEHGWSLVDIISRISP